MVLQPQLPTASWEDINQNYNSCKICVTQNLEFYLLGFLSHHKHQFKIIQAKSHIEQFIDIHQKHKIFQSIFSTRLICVWKRRTWMITFYFLMDGSWIVPSTSMMLRKIPMYPASQQVYKNLNYYGIYSDRSHSDHCLVPGIRQLSALEEGTDNLKVLLIQLINMVKQEFVPRCWGFYYRPILG